MSRGETAEFCSVPRGVRLRLDGRAWAPAVPRGNRAARPGSAGRAVRQGLTGRLGNGRRGECRRPFRDKRAESIRAGGNNRGRVMDGGGTRHRSASRAGVSCPHLQAGIRLRLSEGFPKRPEPHAPGPDALGSGAGCTAVCAPSPASGNSPFPWTRRGTRGRCRALVPPSWEMITEAIRHQWQRIRHCYRMYGRCSVDA